MSRIAFATAFFVCICAALAAQTPFPSAFPPPSTGETSSNGKRPTAAGPYSISGIVVSATTGAPLDRVTMMLSRAGEQPSNVGEATTNETGAFRFDHLAAGKYTLEADRPGYLTSHYQEHDGFATDIVTGKNLEGQNLRFELVPAAVLGGTITDSSGEPVPNARVTLYRQTDQNGESRTRPNRGEMTDETGSYEFASLEPGNYDLSVSARPWYAFRPRPKVDASGNLLPIDQQPQSPLDLAYPTTFYPETTDSEAAQPIAVPPGGHLNANLSLQAVPAIHLRVRQADSNPRGPSIPQLSENVFGVDQVLALGPVTVSGTPSNRVIDIGGIAPGHYRLLQRAPGIGLVNGSGIDLTSDQTIDLSTPLNQTEVSGKLAMASGEALPASLRVALVPEGGGAANATGVSSDGLFDFRSVVPGTYEIQLESAGSPLVMVQMAASGAAVHGVRFTVAEDPVLVAATLESGSTTVNGYVEDQGKGIGGIMVFLVPRDADANDELNRRDQTSTDGSFTLTNVAPGNYLIVAIKNGWKLDWSAPNALATYLLRGVPVQIGTQQKLDLPKPIEVQP